MSGNKTEPLVSVIINCYNGDKFLRQAIDSVCSQTYKNWEIIFWDNCSSDKSADIAKEYGDRLKYFRAEINTPLGHARNLAMQKANGEFIAFLDVDDIWYPDKLSLQINEILTDNDYCICYSGVEEVLEDETHFRYYIPGYKSGYLINQLLENFNIHIVAALIRKSCLEESNMKFDEHLTASEEYCLFINLSLMYPIAVVNQPLVKYRVSMNSLTSRMSDKLGYERRYSLELLKTKQHFSNKVNIQKFKKAYLHSYYYDAKYHVTIGNRWKAINCMIKTQLSDIKHIFLFFILFLPLSAWKKVHMYYRNRH
ncbi:Glycosyltransferase involved in cell wall bisynthesis [Hydrobacter penzbergensis]|uniref:Glycosyltransferase involved in cell wall bisynthesis n=1 Tax=Hydrobacter penzbergensis TaxID=1235997 RepID=A0A8X8LEZ1_9BACT|nr:glycosyltransferase family 2 protein [Hydrobacter penzbergensis]SDW85469.1 Glycosyltransferase involved in cell wall bisynthesis [Hydrobacter penzbergensis]